VRRVPALICATRPGRRRRRVLRNHVTPCFVEVPGHPDRLVLRCVAAVRRRRGRGARLSMLRRDCVDPFPVPPLGPAQYSPLLIFTRVCPTPLSRRVVERPTDSRRTREARRCRRRHVVYRLSLEQPYSEAGRGAFLQVHRRCDGSRNGAAIIAGRPALRTARVHRLVGRRSTSPGRGGSVTTSRVCCCDYLRRFACRRRRCTQFPVRATLPLTLYRTDHGVAFPGHVRPPRARRWGRYRRAVPTRYK